MLDIYYENNNLMLFMLVTKEKAFLLEYMWEKGSFCVTELESVPHVSDTWNMHVFW